MMSLVLLLVPAPEGAAAPAAALVPPQVMVGEANDRIEAAVAARRAGQQDLSTVAAARGMAEGLASERQLPLTLRRLQTTEAWTDQQADQALAAWGLLRQAEADLPRAKPEDLSRALEVCRELDDRWCEARALLARAGALAQSQLTPEVREDLLAAEPILRQAGPSVPLARALILMRGMGVPPAEMAAKARERYTEAIGLSRDLARPAIEGLALCEMVRLELTTGQRDAARTHLDRIGEIAKGVEEPRVAACGAYFEGLFHYFARDPKAAREVWDRFMAAPASRRTPREALWILVGGAAASIDLLDFEGVVRRGRLAVEIGSRLNGDADLLPAYCNLTRGLIGTGDKRDAELNVHKCIDLSRKHKRRDAEASGLRHLGDLADNATTSLELHRQALAITRENKNERDAGWLTLAIASDLLDLGRVKESLPHFEEGLAIAEKLSMRDLKTFLMASLARARAVENRLDDSEALARQALALAAGTEIWSARARGFALRSLGLARQGRHDYTGALARYREAFDQFGLGRDKGMQARTAIDLGNVHLFLGRLSRAYDHYEIAAKLARDASVSEPETTAISNMELIKRRYRTTEQSKKFLMEAARHAAELRSTPSEVVSLLNLAATMQKLGDLESAEATARQALALTRKMDKADLAAEALYRLSWLLSNAGRHEEAVAGCRSALEKEPRLGSRDRIQVNMLCGEVFLRSGRAAEAVTYLARALDLTERGRDLLDQPDLRYNLLSDKVELAPLLAAAILETAGPTPSPTVVEQIFEISERLRARGLLEALAGEHDVDGRSTEMTALRADLLSRMAALHLSYAGSTAAAPDSLLTSIRRLEAELEERAPPGVAPRGDLLLGSQVIGLKQAQMEIPAGTAVLEFLIGGRYGLLLVITRDRAQALRLRSPEELAEQVSLFRGLLERRGPDLDSDEKAIRTLGERLYEATIGMAADQIPRDTQRLIIIPDAHLNLLPFEALVLPSEDGGIGATYLVERYEVTLAPSLTVLAKLRERITPLDTQRTLAAFADPVPIPARAATDDSDDGRDAPVILPVGLPALPYSRDEVDRASERLAGMKIVRTGGDATELKVRRALTSGYKVVHIAAHGFLDTYSNGRSGVVLSAEPAAGNDGLLQAREILGLPVRAGLVVLSGCATGSGKVVVGEGVLGLPHALFQAGAPSIVMSLWQVRDRGAALFMDRFYAGLSEGLTLSAAMRRARLDLIGSGRRDLAHPSVWAPFVLAGVGDRPLFRGLPPAGKPAWSPLMRISMAAAALAALTLWVSRQRSGTARRVIGPEAVPASRPLPPAR